MSQSLQIQFESIDIRRVYDVDMAGYAAFKAPLVSTVACTVATRQVK